MADRVRSAFCVGSVIGEKESKRREGLRREEGCGERRGEARKSGMSERRGERRGEIGSGGGKNETFTFGGRGRRAEGRSQEKLRQRPRTVLLQQKA